MQYIKKALRLLGLVLILTMASVGLGFNAAIIPSSNRQETTEPKIELVESKEEESETENKEKT